MFNLNSEDTLQQPRARTKPMNLPVSAAEGDKLSPSAECRVGGEGVKSGKMSLVRVVLSTQPD